jgi:hypothetical protein
VQVDPIKPKLKPPGTKPLKPRWDVLLSTSAFEFKLRRYTTDEEVPGVTMAKLHKMLREAGPHQTVFAQVYLNALAASALYKPQDPEIT